MPTTLNMGGFLRYPGNYKNLLFYKKTVVLYDMTAYFCGHWLDARRDRTVDQMVQAARSGKQNIAEGTSDGMTSTEMEMKLINVARSSLQELLEDYEDYIRTHSLSLWDKEHPRYQRLVDFCYHHHEVEQYNRYFDRWGEEEFCNTAITLIHQADRGMMGYMKKIEKNFMTNGGLREQMASSRHHTRGY